MTPADLPDLIESWRLHLRGQRKSPQTLKAYTDGVRLFLAWCERTGTTATLDRRTVNAFVADMLDQGAEAATARSRQLALRRFTSWLAEEGELDTDPLIGLKPPKLDSKVVPALTTEQILALLKACEGKEFRDRRDEAIVRLMVETGIRSEELLSMQLADLNLRDGETVIRRGKGGKGRRVPIGPEAAASVDRYLRMRRAHRLAGTPVIWLGQGGKEFGYHALRDTLRYRADRAGLPEGFSPHKLRHTAASRWLERGGSEGGLMAMAGWSRRDMIDRYTKSTSERRAIDEARQLGLGRI